MPAIITVHNLPSIVNTHLLQKILTENSVRWEKVLLIPSQTNTDSTQDAYILLRHRGEEDIAIRTAVRRINECEVSDQVLTAEPAPDSAIQLFETALEQAPIIQNQRHSKRKSPAVDLPEIIQLEDLIAVDPTEEMETSEDEDEEDVIPQVLFSEMGLSPIVIENLHRKGYEIAMPIQAFAIPTAMEGCDLIGKAQTGTGKTLAFTIPIIERLMAKPGRGIRALVLAPTRELAVQIKKDVDDITPNTGLRAVVVYGGESILDQMIQLHEGVDILIATPGRLLDLQGRGRLRFDASEILVLDEADRMLDMGFIPQIRMIFQCFYEHPQTMLFSATFPKELNKITGVNLVNPVYVDVGKPDLTPLETVTQEVLYVSPDEKDECLYQILDHEEGPVIVFAKTKRSTEKLAQKLKKAGYPATRIHGDISQADRTRAIEEFRRGRYKILVGTDVAARGLHIEGVAHVINYDLPMAPEDHLHRIGRTARAGASGKATTFITHAERKTSKHFKGVFGQSKS